MTTLAQLADRVQNQLADSAAGTWEQTLIEEWCVEAIRDYSQHLPRTLEVDIATVDGMRAYDLPPEFRSVMSVAYPVAEDPPRYLQQLSYLDERFWRSSGYFDVLEVDDASSPDRLLLSATPATGEAMTVIYRADHKLALDSGDVITVPARHEHVLVDFVMWRAWLQLLGGEQQSPTSNSSLLMSQYASNADRAKRQYVESLARALRSEEGKSAMVRWRVDKWDGVY